MTDIHQWRRMIQPARTRTPAADTDDSDGVLSPTTPLRTLRPKLSTYLTQQTASTGPTKNDLLFSNAVLTPDLPSWAVNDPAPSPNAERLIDSMMSRLLADPYEPLDARFNGILLEIFECFRNTSDTKNQLQSTLDHESNRRLTLEHAMHESAQHWHRERQEYKAEVKRLELLLAKGERGLAEVTLARQDSALRPRHRTRAQGTSDKPLETIFEFLERTKRYDDKAWSSQRATMKKRPTSPSMAMRRLSKTLATSSPMSTIHYDLPFGTPADVSLLENTRRKTEPSLGIKTSDGQSYHAQELGDVGPHFVVPGPGASHSDGSLSTFSCTGDLLSDEVVDVNFDYGAGKDNDLVAIKQIAQTLAKRWNVDPHKIMSKLHELFGVGVDDLVMEKGRSNSLPNDLEPQCPLPASVTVEHSLAETNFAKHPRLKTKASGFFARWKPQLNIDTSSNNVRRFSFEPGDDTTASLSAPPLDNLPAAVKDRLLRKSVSLSFLSESAASRVARVAPPLSPVQQSPTTSAPQSDCRKPTRIPTPAYSNGSLARPRQEREDSASSLLTAIKLADDAGQESDSSSAFSSPPTSQVDLTQDIQGAEKGATRNPLLEHTNALRGNAFAAAAAAAAAAAKTAITIASTADHGTAATSAHGKRSRHPGCENDTR